MVAFSWQTLPTIVWCIGRLAQRRAPSLLVGGGLFFSTMLIRQIYKPNSEMRKTMFQNHRLSYDDDDLLRRKSPLASKRRETIQRGNDSARRPKCSVSAAPVESGRRDVGANSLLSTLLRYLASLLAGSTLASLMPPTKYNSSLSVAEKTGAAFRSSHQEGCECPSG